MYVCMTECIFIHIVYYIHIYIYVCVVCIYIVYINIDILVYRYYGAKQIGGRMKGLK